MDFDKKAIGERIKEYRLKNGFTQSDLAKEANITRIALGNYERGERIPTIDIFARIAMALNVSIDELMGYKPGQLSTIQQIKQDFEMVGYKVKENVKPRNGYDITMADDYPFYIESQQDLQKMYHQTILDVFWNQKKIWKDSIYHSLLKYERKKYHEK